MGAAGLMVKVKENVVFYAKSYEICKINV